MAIYEQYPVISKDQIVNLDFENEIYPYKKYSELRTKGPLIKIESGGWIATSYDFVNSMFRDKRFHTLKIDTMATQTLLQNKNSLVKTVATPPLKFMIKRDRQVKITNSWLNFTDPPVHTRLRKLAQTAFTPKAIKTLLPRMKEITFQLLDQVEQKSEFDLVEDFSLPLPITMIAEILGVSGADQEKFKKWSKNLLEGFSFGEMTKEKRKQTIQTIDEMTDYLINEINNRESSPKEDVISYFVTAKEDNDSMTQEEVISNIVLLLIAGHETTVNLITNTIYALLSNYDQFELLLSDKSLLNNTIEEGLRFDPPAPGIPRVASQDIDFNGYLIKKGDQIDLSIYSANRDPEMFPNPDIFDITRENSKNHLAFGQGIHYCLGAPLARAEAEIAFSEIIDRFPNLKLKPSFKPRRNKFFGLNSFEKMLLIKR